MNKKTFTFLLITLFFIPKSYSQIGCYDMVLFDDVDVYLNHEGVGVLWKGDILDNPDYCPDYATVEMYTPDSVYIGANANCTWLNQVIPVKVIHPTSGAFAWSTVIPRDTLGPYIACQDTFTYCTSDTSPLGVGVPFMEDNCTSVESFSYTDEVLYFDCGVEDFDDYFAPHNWCHVECNGNGYEDTLSAPASIELFGAHDLPPLSIGAYVNRYKITIPAEGYVSFDWSVTGVNSLMDISFFTINDTCLVLNELDTLQGHFDSWLLEPGDVISFDLKSNGDLELFSLLIENFVFNTAAEKIIYRTWTAVDALGNINSCTQDIVVYRVFDQNVYFPPNYGMLTNNAFACDDPIHPSFTGYPFVDIDGDLATTDDQTSIENSTCLQATYEDLVFDICGGSKKIARTWTVISDCSNEIDTYTQLIEFVDQLAPVWTCPQDTIFVSTSAVGCYATVNVGIPPVQDVGCGSDVDVTVSSVLGAGTGPFFNVAIGTYDFVLTATDECGNASTCTQVVQIVDEVSPTMVCQQHIVATIGTLGSIDVFPPSFDDGSYDNCCLLGFEVLRTDDASGVYGPSVSFDCSDIGTMKFVYLKATDCNGLSNICMVEVEVQDNVAPVMNCPANMNISCAAGYSNLDQYGAPVVSDNCNFDLNYTEDISTDNCGIGQIVRTWIATDDSGNTNSCSQILSIVNDNPWNANNDQIIWPLDLDLATCNGSLHPDSLETAYAYPQFDSPGFCSLVAINHTDEVFEVAGEACFQINRTWTIDDWCQTNNGSGNGVWTHVQILRVIDDVAPVFEGVVDGLVFGITATECAGDVTIPMPTIIDCNPNINVQATSVLGNGFGPFSNVPVGEYEVEFVADDACGNVTTETITLSVVDIKKPSPYCFGDQVFTLENTNAGVQQTVMASQLNLNSSDNCTAAADLIFSFSSDVNDETYILDCDDLGYLALDMWVTDEAGNQEFCTVTIQVQDNTGFCDGNTGIVLSGNIATPNGETINLVEVSGEFTSMTNLDETAIDGNYSFGNVVLNDNGEIIPFKDVNHRNGLTAFDLSLLENHINGISTLAGPYSIIGADFNNDQTIDSTDWVLLKDMILFNIDEWANVPSWRFVPEAFNFPDNTDPFLTPFPESVTVLNIANSVPGIDFVGIKMGDYDQSLDPTQLVVNDQNLQTGIQDRTNKTIDIHVVDQYLEKGKEYSISMRMGETDYGVSSLQFTVDFDALSMSFVEVESDDMDDFGRHNTGFKYVDEGYLTFVKVYKGEVAETDEIVYQFRIKSDRNMYLHDVLELNDAMTLSRAYLPFEGNDAAALNLVFVDSNGQPIKVDNTFELLNNFPNPFNDITFIEFRSITEESVQLEIYDATGKVLLSNLIDSQIGLNRFEVSGDILGQDGVYFYKLTNGTTSLTKSMVLIRN